MYLEVRSRLRIFDYKIVECVLVKVRSVNVPNV
jgi:hypothetical protein